LIYSEQGAEKSGSVWVPESPLFVLHLICISRLKLAEAGWGLACVSLEGEAATRVWLRQGAHLRWIHHITLTNLPAASCLACIKLAGGRSVLQSEF